MQENSVIGGEGKIMGDFRIIRSEIII